MSRLTAKKEDSLTNYKVKKIDENWTVNIQNCINKLGKLEDLEEELGCPLEVLFKVLKDGIADKRFGVNYDECKLEFKKYYGYILVCEDDEYLVKDYRKTWWLRGDKNVKN